jgi:hypothetical protein
LSVRATRAEIGDQELSRGGIAGAITAVATITAEVFGREIEAVIAAVAGEDDNVSAIGGECIVACARDEVLGFALAGEQPISQCCVVAGDEGGVVGDGDLERGGERGTCAVRNADGDGEGGG